MIFFNDVKGIDNLWYRTIGFRSDPDHAFMFDTLSVEEGAFSHEFLLSILFTFYHRE